MEYDQFDELVTARHCIIVKNWPLKKFSNPSNVTSRIELEVLYNAWQSGATYFQKLTRGEMEAWESDRFSSRIELIPPPTDSPVPALAIMQPPAEMTLFSELPRQDHLGLTPTPSSHTPPDISLAPITNVTSVTSALATTSYPPTPDPDMIARMIEADPALQNVDPTLIAMGISEGNQRRAAAITTTTPTEKQHDQVRHANGPKRRWQEIVTPHSFSGIVVKKPRKQRKDKHPKNPQAVQGSEN
jgi:hypothetical protein